MSAQVVSGPVNVNAALVQTDTAGLVVPIQAACTANYLINLVNGTGAANAIDCIYAKTLSLAGAATHINLYSFTDPLGNTVSMARCRFWFVYVTTLTAAYLVNIYTRTGTDPVTWLPQVTTATLWCPPGGLVMGVDPASTSTNGWVVSSSAFDFTLDPGANTVACSVVIAGNTAA